MSNKRVAYIVFKRTKAAAGMDAFGQPHKPGPILLDMAFGSWERSNDRHKLLRGWGYETASVELRTNPEDDTSDYGCDLQNLNFH